MSDLRTRCDMENLKMADIDAYKDEIAKPWSTMTQDIEYLEQLIVAHGQTLGEGKKVLSVFFQQVEEGVDIKLPDWVIEACLHFEDTYGNDYGSVVFEKTLFQLWEQFQPAQPVSFS